MTTLFSILEIGTVIVTILVTASGLPSCLQMYKSKCTKGVPYALFLAYAFASTISIQYALMIENRALVQLNTVCLMLWVVYISVYCLVTSNKADAFLKASGMLFVYWAHLQYLALQPSERVLPVLGLYMVFWCSILALLPILDIMEMLETKSHDSCDMSMLHATTLSSAVWFVYGVVLNDINIWFAAATGLAVNFAKYALIFKYKYGNYGTQGSSKKLKKKPAKMNGHNNNMASEFHEQVYRIRPRNSLHKGIQ